MTPLPQSPAAIKTALLSVSDKTELLIWQKLLPIKISGYYSRGEQPDY